MRPQLNGATLGRCPSTQFELMETCTGCAVADRAGGGDVWVLPRFALVPSLAAPKAAPACFQVAASLVPRGPAHAARAECETTNSPRRSGLLPSCHVSRPVAGVRLPQALRANAAHDQLHYFSGAAWLSSSRATGGPRPLFAFLSFVCADSAPHCPTCCCSGRPRLLVCWTVAPAPVEPHHGRLAAHNLMVYWCGRS